ncbi:hypothetical protein [Bacillus sp. 1P02SD]|uniref:hypothetical protein n=1 Tax=Bacillus sp. 1P02SD TaxID=3132264 RepID=UPI0039A39FD9
MSLKLVELQVAIPRTQDAGKIQEQVINRGQHMQDHITAENEKLEKRNRTKVNENNKSENAQIHKDASSNSFSKQPSNGTKHAEQEEKEQHPYKGNFIDIVG